MAGRADPGTGATDGERRAGDSDPRVCICNLRLLLSNEAVTISALVPMDRQRPTASARRGGGGFGGRRRAAPGALAWGASPGGQVAGQDRDGAELLPTTGPNKALGTLLPAQNRLLLLVSVRRPRANRHHGGLHCGGLHCCATLLRSLSRRAPWPVTLWHLRLQSRRISRRSRQSRRSRPGCGLGSPRLPGRAARHAATSSQAEDSRLRLCLGCGGWRFTGDLSRSDAAASPGGGKLSPSGRRRGRRADRVQASMGARGEARHRHNYDPMIG